MGDPEFRVELTRGPVVARGSVGKRVEGAGSEVGVVVGRNCISVGLGPRRRMLIIAV